MITLHNNFTFDDLKEMTIEVEPDSISSEKLELYTTFGVNRLSMGIQSFNQKTLDVLGRGSSLQDIKNALSLIKNFGDTNENFKNYKNVNFDLLLGNPYESYSEFEYSLKTL